MSKIIFRMEIFKEGGEYVSLCSDLNISSYGSTIKEAKNSLIEAVEAFIETCEEIGSLNEVLEEGGFHKIRGRWEPREPVVEQKVIVPA
jgi:hypothetical protein